MPRTAGRMGFSGLRSRNFDGKVQNQGPGKMAKYICVGVPLLILCVLVACLDFAKNGFLKIDKFSLKPLKTYFYIFHGCILFCNTNFKCFLFCLSFVVFVGCVCFVLLVSLLLILLCHSFFSLDFCLLVVLSCSLSSFEAFHVFSSCCLSYHLPVFFLLLCFFL